MKRFGQGMRAIALATTAIFFAAGTATAQIEDYPNKPVKVIMPFGPGSNPDTVTRIIAQQLQQRLGQPFVIEQRQGAGGSIGMGVLAKSPPDGYTIGVGHISNLAIDLSIYKKLPYDIGKDLIPVSQTYRTALIAVVAENSPYKTVGELVSAAKANPGKLTFSSGGNGTSAHMSGAYANSLAGTAMTHVPYRTAGDSMVAVVGGDITLTFVNQSAAWPLVEAKKLRPLALSSAVRAKDFPQLPVVGETIKGFELYEWGGIVVPAGTPAPIVAKLQSEIKAILAEPDVIRKLHAMYLEPVTSTTAEFSSLIEVEGRKWGKVAHDIKLRLD